MQKPTEHATTLTLTASDPWGLTENMMKEGCTGAILSLNMIMMNMMNMKNMTNKNIMNTMNMMNKKMMNKMNLTKVGCIRAIFSAPEWISDSTKREDNDNGMGLKLKWYQAIYWYFCNID